MAAAAATDLPIAAPVGESAADQSVVAVAADGVVEVDAVVTAVAAAFVSYLVLKKDFVGFEQLPKRVHWASLDDC